MTSKHVKKVIKFACRSVLESSLPPALLAERETWPSIKDERPISSLMRSTFWEGGSTRGNGSSGVPEGRGSQGKRVGRLQRKCLHYEI